MLAERPPRAGALVVLPEMFASGFSMNVARIAQEPSGELSRGLAQMAKDRGIWIVAGVVGRDSAGRGRNLARVYSPQGTLVAEYQKMHPFSFSGEHEHYSPGEGPITFAWGEFSVAPFVCYDLRFPEVFRLGVRRGANLLVVIANWPAARQAHWLTLLSARAIENQAYVVGVNRVGRDPKATYAGRSQIIDPRGTVLADGGEEPGVISAEVDPQTVAAYRREFPALADIRLNVGV
jgi:predicted amidohydrolase